MSAPETPAPRTELDRAALLRWLGVLALVVALVVVSMTDTRPDPLAVLVGLLTGAGVLLAAVGVRAR